jgi:hypothetical protein
MGLSTTPTKLHRDAGALFEYLGCDSVETYYPKWLGD